MALRVLLADESTTIKKVMQLALQDYAVEVKAVHAGVDALEAARAFQPDVVFADVLLQKRNGYDVCSDLKADPELNAIPVVLMWSSFMDLDEKAFAASRADAKLEKPFDVDSLRALVQQLVARAGSSRIAPFLRFPASFVEPLETEEEAKKKSAPAPAAQASRSPAPAAPGARPAPPAAGPAKTPPPLTVAPAPELAPEPDLSDPAIDLAPPDAAAAWDMNSFDDIQTFEEPSEDEADAFAPFKLNPVKLSPTKAPAAQRPLGAPGREGVDESEEPWSHQDLAKFKVELPPVEVASEDMSLVVSHQDAPPDQTFLLNAERLRLRPLEKPQTATERGTGAAPPPASPSHAPSLESPHEPSFELDPSSQEASATPLMLELESPLGADEDGFHLTTFGAEEEAAPAPSIAPTADPLPFKIDVPEQPFRLDPSDAPAAKPARPAEPQTQTRTRTPAEASVEPGALNADQLEAIVRAQSQEIIESVVRRIVPDIASQLIKKELERLLAEQGDSGR